ncbi:EmrB/QacA subfamily drug resistance transporter [Allocatelliglobosispora scoriae]|uniref:EmrB/QacA subfamily drug resistance transporter n=1 Tax=Allocatelliglobosispora scoriae TaxID=643052 RepID=A0A841BN87_9ACTN|nr:MFS transporter [Allocatelliglobosispora scoriae]MBB5868212.1 EmrB/QacA subfamily drug resistance transporter [Allocatelliglobosispora scoriae]
MEIVGGVVQDGGMRKWSPLIAICLGAFMLLVDVTIVVVALPAMSDHLDTSMADLQWVLDGYALALAALLLGAGTIADRIGRRRVYAAGLAIFAVSSAACGLAPNAEVLIAARCVQGIGAAAMFATTMALLNQHYQGRDRGIAFGVWGAINGAAAATGPIVGGLLTEHAGWRWIFLVNLPVSIITVIMVYWVLRESRGDAHRRVDVGGMLTFTLAAAATVYGLVHAGQDGWSDPTTLAGLGVGAAALVAFLLIEVRHPQPMLDLALFRRPGFVGLMVGSLLISWAAFAYLAFTSIWLQIALGFGPVDAGLALLPMSLTALVVAGIAGRRLADVSPRWTISAGLALIAAGAFLQTSLDASSGRWAIAVGLIVSGVGVGLATPPLASAAMSSVPIERGGMASGAVNTFRQLGYALGIAVLGTVFADHLTGTGSRRAAFADAVNAVCVVSGIVGAVAAVIVFWLVRRPAPTAASGTSPQRDLVAALD